MMEIREFVMTTKIRNIIISDYKIKECCEKAEISATMLSVQLRTL
jgi:hypothetical protein